VVGLGSWGSDILGIEEDGERGRERKEERERCCLKKSTK
jgi:hypothetical protein